MRLPVLAAALAAAAMLTGCARTRARSVLWVTFDTTRPDFIGAYGKETARTPNLDSLAVDGTLFLNAFTAVPITLPSHSTMFTGTYPLVHGVRDNGMFRLPESRMTLAEVLKDRGFATGAAVGGFPLVRSSGIAQGFDFFDDHISIGREDYKGERVEGVKPSHFEERPAPQVNDAILPWLRAHAGGPFFAWVHYWDPHQPHIPPAPFKDMYPQDLYQAEIAYADQSLGVLLQALKSAGVYDETLVVMSADHGEGRGSHNEESHSMLAYNTTLHVPLIVKVPGEPGRRRVGARVGLVDVMPTILDFLGIAPPSGVQGHSLRTLMGKPDAGGRDDGTYYAETLSPRLAYGLGELRVLFDGRYKYIHGPRPELFDLSQDPDENRNLVAELPAEKTRMEKVLAAFLSKNASPTASDAVHEADPAARERLAALGYLSAAGEVPGSIREELRSDGIPPQDRIADVNRWTLVKDRLAARDYLTAKELGQELVARDPASGFYRGMLVLAHLGLGQVEEAAAVAEKGGPVGPGNEEPYLELAERLMKEGQTDRALVLARRIVADRPKTAPAHYLLAEVHGRLGQREPMVAALKETLRLDPQHRDARLALAVDLAEAGDVPRAEENFRALLSSHPSDAAGRLNFGTLLLKNGRKEEGEAEIRRAIALAPNYWKAHLALLAALIDKKETAAAERVFRGIQEGCRDPKALEQAREMMSYL